MMPRMLARGIVGLALIAVFCSSSAAKPPPRKAAAAKQHYDAGIALYRAQKYDEAIVEFEAGYALAPESHYLYNLGQACRLALKPDCALEYYRKYLEEEPEAENRAAVEQRIAEVQHQLDARRAPPPPPPPAAPPPPSEPEPRAAPVRATPAAKEKPLTPYELGVYVRGIFVIRAMFNPFLQAATSMASVATGIQFTYHKPKFDVVTSLDFSYLDVEDGNWLANDHDASLDTHYLQFRNLSFLSVDVALVGHNDLTRWLEIRYGAGLGIGVVLGDVLSTNSWGNCTAANTSDLAACHPIGVDLTSPQREQQLRATEGGGTDTAATPHRHVSDDKPPVMGVLNLMFGFKFKITRHFNLTVESGFRDAFFVGIGAGYRF
jgi:hypothetical protein